MIYSDLHMHTRLSPDSTAPMEDMARAAAESGMGCVCFTDHCDTVDWDTLALTDARKTVFPETLLAFADLKSRGAVPEGLEILLGLEIGEAHFDAETARSYAAQPGLDMVIGSVHILKGEGDFYFIKYRDIPHCQAVFDTYMDELLSVAELDFFDICGHIGYPCRYMRKMGFDVDIMSPRYRDRLQHLLQTLIKNGRGIELNMSGFGSDRGPFPVPAVLKLYKELGGEIITTGSDAHAPADAGRGIREGVQLLRELGYRYVSVFRGRTPDFVKI